MYGLNSSQFASAAFLWPALIAESASELASAAARELVSLAIAPQPQTSAREPQWVTQNRVALELLTVRLRDFSTSAEGLPVLICAPFALHASSITDFAPNHSLVAALQGSGVGRVFVTDWRSATPDMRFLSIDNYLADLNVLIDELGGRVNLLGMCQGGWMALAYAARFPRKLGKLVLAGAPIDIAAGNSNLSELAHKTPIGVFRSLVDLGRGASLGSTLCSSGRRIFPSAKRFANCCSRRMRPAPKLLGGWKLASEIGTHQHSICRGPTICRWSNICSRRTASPPAVSWRLAAKSICPSFAARCSCLPHRTTTSLLPSRYLPQSIWSVVSRARSRGRWHEADISACSWVGRLLRIPGRISLAGFGTERRRS